MLIRREDFKDISSLTKGSQKKIWFTCEDCGIGVLQAYRNYLKQKDGHFCRSCRNKRSGKKIKDIHSENSKKRWQDKEYKKEMSEKLSRACKDAWDKDDGTRKKKIRNKTSYNKMKTLIESENYKVITTKESYEKLNKKKILVKCHKEHMFSTTLSRWKNGHRCPYCSHKKVDDSEIIEFLAEFGYKFLGRKYGERGGSIIKYECDKGHTGWKRLDSFRRGTKCKKCFGSESNQEKEIKDFIKEIYDGKIIENDRSIIKPMELDIVIPEKNIAIEYCGLYWHSEKQGKDKKYHYNKMVLCNEKGYRLLQIFEDEWLYKRDIVKDRLLHILGKNSKRIYARKCFIKEIDAKTARKFVDRYHIQGYTGSSIKIGAFYNDKMVAVMTFAKPSLSKGRKDNDNLTIFELSRFCTSCSVIGVAGKLFKFFQRNYEWDEIYSFADLRWSEGNVYKKIGFEMDSISQPNYWYFKDDKKRKHRFLFRKNVLSEKLDTFDPKKTEIQNMYENGWNRIFDAGNLKFIIKKGEK